MRRQAEILNSVLNFIRGGHSELCSYVNKVKFARKEISKKQIVRLLQSFPSCIEFWMTRLCNEAIIIMKNQ